MSTTHDGNATTTEVVGTPAHDDGINATSTEGATTMTTTVPNVPIPAGAVSVDEFEGGGRMFYGSTAVTIKASGWQRVDVDIRTSGFQNDDGSYRWEIVAGEMHPDMPLTAAQARQIGEALLAAADELDAIEAVAK